MPKSKEAPTTKRRKEPASEAEAPVAKRRKKTDIEENGATTATQKQTVDSLEEEPVDEALVEGAPVAKTPIAKRKKKADASEEAAVTDGSKVAGAVEEPPATKRKKKGDTSKEAPAAKQPNEVGAEESAAEDQSDGADPEEESTVKNNAKTVKRKEGPPAIWQCFCPRSYAGYKRLFQHWNKHHPEMQKLLPTKRGRGKGFRYPRVEFSQLSPQERESFYVTNGLKGSEV